MFSEELSILERYLMWIILFQEYLCRCSHSGPTTPQLISRWICSRASSTASAPFPCRAVPSYQDTCLLIFSGICFQLSLCLPSACWLAFALPRVLSNGCWL